MASQAENQAKGFAGAPRSPRPNQGRSQGGIPVEDAAASYSAAPQLGQEATQAGDNSMAVAAYMGAATALHQKAARLQGAQGLIEAARAYRNTGTLPEDPALAEMVLQYASLEQLELQMQGDFSSFFSRQEGGGFALAMPKLGPTSFSQAAEVLGKAPGQFLALPQQDRKTLPEAK